MKKYAIIQYRNYYGPSRTTTLLMDGPRVLTLDSPREARAWIAEQDSQPYSLAHNEYSRPEYRVTTVGSARFCAAYRATTGGLEWDG